MSKIIIAGNPVETRIVDKREPFLNIAEMFGRTVQGEGVSTGVPALFLRLKNCTLSCVWCDSTSVWREGNPYTIQEVLDLLEESGAVEDFRNGYHWVQTGGSPLLQDKNLAILMQEFITRFGFKPFVEIENECVRIPDATYAAFVDQWNNSPKLANSEMKEKLRYKPEVIKHTAALPNSWFKFVLSSEEDWNELKRDFLDTGLIARSQVIVMPCGSSQEELSLTRELVVDIAIRECVRYSDRTHVIIWNLKTGV